MKTNILEFFYEHVDEEDWLIGLDLYTSGKVEKIKAMHGLVTARISSISLRGEETRLKIHPNGHCIQWIECTCKKNRSSGQFCEHLASFMISIDRERPELLATLDARMPLKQPVAVRKKSIKTQAEGEKRDRGEGAAQTILSHLKGNIQSVRLLANGPTMKVRLELKQSEYTNYHLEIDEAAKFLQSHPKLANASDEIKALKVFNLGAIRGTRIYQEDDEKVVAERVVAIPHSPATFNKLAEKANHHSIFPESHRMVTRTDLKGKDGNFEFVSLKNAQKYLGKEYFFLPERGYWKLLAEDVSPIWNDLPIKKIFKEDASANFIQENFSEYINEGPIWLDQNLKAAVIESTPKLNEIRIHKAEDGWFFLDPRYQSGQ